MAGQTIHAMQFQVFVEARHAHESLECRFLHLLDVREAHVIVDQSENLASVVVREPQSLANFFRHRDADIDVAIETNAVGRNSKRRWLTHIVQQRAPRQRDRTGMRQLVKQ